MAIKVSIDRLAPMRTGGGTQLACVMVKIGTHSFVALLPTEI